MELADLKKKTVPSLQVKREREDKLNDWNDILFMSHSIKVPIKSRL